MKALVANTMKSAPGTRGKNAPRARGKDAHGRLLAGAIVFAVALAGFTATASAQDPSAACSFIEIKASNDGTGIDDKLKPLAKKLERPPFSSWKSFQVVATHSKNLTHMKAEEVALTLGGKLAAILRSRSAGAKARMEVGLTIDNKKGKRALSSKVTVAGGQYFIIAFETTADSGNLLAFTCK